jgi:hypothetical protein
VNEGLHGVLRQTASRPSHRRAGHFVTGGLFEGLQSFADLESRIVALPTQQERGDAFEVFAEAYLATQKLVGAEEVWPADRIPFAVLQACRLPLQDLGADGVRRGVVTTTRPLPEYDPLDVAYLGTVILDAAGVPLPAAQRERKRLMMVCAGRYSACEPWSEILAFHRRLINSGLVRTP